MNDEIFTEVISPAGIPRIPDEALTPRPGTLEGATLGILENNKEFSDWVLDRVRDQLLELVGIKEVVQLRKHHLAQSAAPETLEELNSRCDAVLVGVGH
ncbi:MAG: hypothetical protein OXL41_13790 [Nitrospinae bacterium]|nr:hypothetical protein [Nitrospinota bacterium]